MKQISPSILACDIINLGKEIKKIEDSGANYVHIDVMDGLFVPNISFGMPIISAVRKSTNLILDVHAMIVEPGRYVDDFINCGADIITFHIEAVNIQTAKVIIEKIKSRGRKVGISIKPDTPSREIFQFIKDVDMILIMTVEPGFGGQSFMHKTLIKIKEIRNYADAIGKDIDIEVDGGINYTTIKLASDAGANIFVLGTGFFKAEKELSARQILSKAE